jgi:hypothetical protein
LTQKMVIYLSPEGLRRTIIAYFLYISGLAI